MLLREVVEVSREVAASSSRLAKRDLLAGLLGRLDPARPDEIDVAATYLSGILRQRRTGVGFRGLAELPPPASQPMLSLVEVDAALERLAGLAGSGSATARKAGVAELFGALTAPEQTYLRAVMTGNVRQGALDSVMLDAIAQAAEVPLGAVRRAAMFSALTGPIAVAALTRGAEALEAFSMVPGRPVRPMLAATAPDVVEAVPRSGTGEGESFVVDTKLDGIRIQVHKVGDGPQSEVSVFTRSLDEIGARFPGLVASVRELPGDLVLDGEALTVDEAGRPRPFQDTASDTARREGDADVLPFFFDLLLHGTDSLVDAPLSERLARLDQALPPAMRTTRLTTADPAAAAAFFDDAVAGGQEGVVLKHLGSPYAAGRRGSAWVKVKPRHTLDLVVLGVEWGSGRRRGTLSNIHLGARADADSSDGSADGFVMLGKTFKGMTDEMLAWQTERFLALETHREGHTVFVRPEQVVEIAFDGVQRSTRYPGKVALRFARVLRYRDDKSPAEADTLATVRSHLR